MAGHIITLAVIAGMSLMFGAQWQPGSVTYYYDGKNVGSITTGITGDPMYLVMGYTVNASDPTPVIPSTMLVDWVRVWKQA